MKNVFLILFMIVIVTLTGCSGNKAAELYETAQFEEVQNNEEHARKLYSEIIERYPESEYAKKAKERLSEL